MAFWFQTRSRTVCEGAVFERTREHNVVERATITWVGKDPFGIPHVRFRLSLPGMDDNADTRILAVTAFQNLYRPSELHGI